MRFRIQVIGLLVLALAFSAAFAPTVFAAANAGGASLQIPPGARAEGMGRFFTAVANDAFTPWWNPGGLAFMKGWNAGLMHAKLVPELADDVYFEYLGVTNHLEGWGGVAATITYLNYGESVATETGSPTEIGTFSSFEFSPSVALGTEVMPNLGLGLNLKLLHVNLAPERFGDGKGTTFAVDLGALYKYDRPTDDLFGLGAGMWGFGLGLTVANLGPDISLTEENKADPLPRNLKLGLSFGGQVPEAYSFLAGLAVEKSLLGSDIPDTLTSTLSYYERNEVLVTGGMEVGIMDLVFGRMGYIYDDVGKIKGWTYGAGFHLQKFGLDFASIPQFEELGRVSKISIVARFD